MSYGEKEPTGAPTRRPHRRLRQAAAIALACAVMLSAAACTIQESKHYMVDASPKGFYAHIFRAPTAQIVAVYEGTGCDVNKTADILRQTVKISGWGAAEWKQALRDDRGSLKTALEDIRAHRSPKGVVQTCLMLKKSMTLFTAGNTSFHESRDSKWCKVGVPFQGNL